jgi:hypothetical protein
MNDRLTAGSGNVQRANCIVPKIKAWDDANVEALSDRNVRALAGDAQRGGVVYARPRVIAVMTSLQLIILLAAVMFVLAIGAASTFI